MNSAIQTTFSLPVSMISEHRILAFDSESIVSPPVCLTCEDIQLVERLHFLKPQSRRATGALPQHSRLSQISSSF